MMHAFVRVLTFVIWGHRHATVVGFCLGAVNVVVDLPRVEEQNPAEAVHHLGRIQAARHLLYPPMHLHLHPRLLWL